MKVAIVGFAIEGRANYTYFKKLGAEITICNETSVDTPDGVDSQIGEKYLDNLDRFDIIVRTAGLKPSKILDKNPGVEDKITTTINEFFKASPTKNIIGVTGTKGKGTTSTIISKILEANGHKVFLAGNYGYSPLEILDEIKPEDYIVLELSSFQLMDLRYSPKTAVCVLVEPEHLDWHKDLDEYIGAKQNLFLHQSPDDMAVFFNQSPLSQKIASVSKGQKFSYFDENLAHVSNEQLMLGDKIICDVSEIKLPGKHSYQNICAAITATHNKVQDIEVFRQAIINIDPLPYRIQLVSTKNGVKYYNDSFSSNPASTIAAIDAIETSKILIVGGKEKNNPVDELAHKIAESSETIKKVIIIGELSDKIATCLEKLNFNKFVNLGTNADMAKIVATASENTVIGDSIILSPGSSSFDMFKNFQDRGDQFNEAVKNYE